VIELNGAYSLLGGHIAVISLNESFGCNGPIVVGPYGPDLVMMLWKLVGMIAMNI
jgi:hypothetical protein